MNFYTYRSQNFGGSIETVLGISRGEIGKLGFLFRELFFIVFKKGVHWTAQIEEIYISIQSDLKDSKF